MSESSRCATESGEIESVVEVESFRPSLDDFGRRARTFEGLGFQTAWLWAGVADEEGHRYALVREHGPGETILFYGLEVSKDVWTSPAVRYAPIPGSDGFYWGGLNYEREGNAQVIIPRNPLYPRLSVSLSPQEIHWRESDWSDLSLVPLPSALRYLCPGKPDSFGYTSQICRIIGTVQGRAVQGFGGYDRYYGEPGIVWVQSKGFRHLEQLWWVWAGRAEDGRTEHGVAITGPGDFRVGYFHREGEKPVTCNHLKHEVEWSERDRRVLPLAVTLEFGGRRFRYRATGNVTIPGADLFIDWLHGEMVEEGVAAPTRCFSWLEYFKHLAKPGEDHPTNRRPGQ